MFAVIFRATVAELDDEYFRMTESDEEIAISYWETEQHIRDWKEDPEHRLAQLKGRDKWYKSFSVEICEIVEK